MSRIHEALKKAEMERAAAQMAGVDGSPSHLAAAVQENSRAVTTQISADMPVKTGPGAAQLGDRLQFSELLELCQRPVWKPDPNSDVVSNPLLNPHAAEQFRTLRSRLYQLRGNQRLSTLLVTSSVGGEGKTFVTGNLAQVIVRQSDRRVLVIDADLRRSRLHEVLGAPPAPGLSDYLRGQASEMEVIQRGQDSNLFFMPGGNVATHPSELLSNGRLKTLLQNASTAFDWILIDSPPCLPVADANVIADYCDGLLFVVRAGMTPSAVVQRAGQELQGRNVVGVVLNSVAETAGYGPYYAEGPYGNDQAQAK
jgi:protein-tyrosine kinase